MISVNSGRFLNWISIACNSQVFLEAAISNALNNPLQLLMHCSGPGVTGVGGGWAGDGGDVVSY